MPGVSHFQHPRFFGYFPSNALLSGVIGDLASTGLGVVGLSWQSGPALTELEEVMCGWMRRMVGLSDAWSGVIQDTASASTLVALITARERATNYAMAKGGLQSATQKLAVYVSEHSHSSVMKAATLAGFGREQVRLVPNDAEFAMRADALAEMVAADIAAGIKPCAVVATSGTTATTALDPVGKIARDREAARALAARRCGDGGRRDDRPRMPVDVGWHRGRRLDRAQSAQMARRLRSTARSISCAIRST